jgi:hypothetical protein
MVGHKLKKHTQITVQKNKHAIIHVNELQIYHSSRICLILIYDSPYRQATAKQNGTTVRQTTITTHKKPTQK